jgi:glutathione S-transferase
LEYVCCTEARPMRGLRLVLSAGVPGPWSEAAKYVFYVRHVPFVPVSQEVFGNNDELFEWTFVRNAPVAMYDDEKPRHTWIDILYLAERLGTGPSLLPATRSAQVECIGLAHQICGEDGLGWNRRLDLFKGIIEAAGGDVTATPVPARALADYGCDTDGMAVSTGRLIEILRMLHGRLEEQKAIGSRYLVGGGLTVADIQFAAFLAMVEPLGEEVNPMPQYLRALYSSGGPELRAAVTSELIAHRDFIYKTHLKLPLDY